MVYSDQVEIQCLICIVWLLRCGELAVAGTYFLNWPVVVVYACTCVDEVGKIPWTLIHFKKYKWVKDLTR